MTDALETEMPKKRKRTIGVTATTSKKPDNYLVSNCNFYGVKYDGQTMNSIETVARALEENAAA